MDSTERPRGGLCDLTLLLPRKSRDFQPSVIRATQERLDARQPGHQGCFGAMLEGAGIDSPAGYLYIRADNHQGYKDAVTGLSKNLPAKPEPFLRAVEPFRPDLVVG